MADQNSIIKTIFNRIDTSGDGKLSYAEVDILLDPRKNPKRGDVDDWRSLLDLEENKKISSVISNITTKVEIKEPPTEKVWKTADEKSIIETIFKRIDTSGDGKLNYVEIDMLLDNFKNPRKRVVLSDWVSILSSEEQREISMVIDNITKKLDAFGIQYDREKQQVGKITFEDFYQEMRGKKYAINFFSKITTPKNDEEQQQEGKITFEEFYQELRGQKNAINFFSVITGGEHIYSTVECDDHRFTRGRF